MIRAGGIPNGTGSPSSQKRQSFPPTAVSPYPPGYAAVAAADAAAASVPGFPPVAGAAAIPPGSQPPLDHASKYQLFNVMIKKNPGLGFSIAGMVDPA